MPDQIRKKIAVLGGGMGSLSAVFELTNYPGWEQYYDITVYQMGWRLGGKLAIGRGPNDRIEEHGIHVFLGFYNNTFRVIQDVYAERKSKALDPESPFQDWCDAFVKQNSVMLPEFAIDLGKWTNITINFPENAMVPGIGPPPDHLKHIIHMIDMICKLEEEFEKFENGWIGSALRFAFSLFPKREDTPHHEAQQKFSKPSKPDFGHLKKVRSHLHAIHNNREGSIPTDIETIEKILASLDEFCIDLGKVLRDLGKKDGRIYNCTVWAQLGITNLQGIFKDKVFDPVTNTFNFKVINNLDYRSWLKKHGASDEVIFSAPVRDIYTLVFAYNHGDTALNGTIAAGTALRGAMLIVLGYKGSVMYKFFSGTADVVIAPIYQVLKSRGVKVEFFNKVKEIYHDDSGVIQKIRMERQMRLADGLSEYDPFVKVKKINSWPKDPKLKILNPDQVTEYNKMYEYGLNVNLESYWTAWKQGEEYFLELGKDFDQIICGIPVAGLKDICSSIIAKNTSWQGMVNNVATVQTQAVQLWLKPTLLELGMDVTKWGMKAGDQPITDTYTNPINSWIDFSNLIPLESWPETNQPGFLVYYCGNMVDAEIIPPPEQSDFPRSQYQRVYDMAVQWLCNNAGYFWPKGTNPENPQGLNFQLLVDPFIPGDSDENEKLQNQFFRANIDPSERYTLSLPNSDNYRLKTDATGYNNLFLAGDWIDCDLNMGCVEATVISGLMCATAVRASYGLKTDPIMSDL